MVILNSPQPFNLLGGDFARTAIVLLEPHIIVCDGHPVKSLPSHLLQVCSKERPSWNWQVNSASLGSAQSRLGKITVFQKGDIPVGRRLAPIFVLAVCLPGTISEFLQPLANSDANILQGAFCVVQSFVSNILEPTPLGRISLPPDTLTIGTNVHTSKDLQAVFIAQSDKSRSLVLVGDERKHALTCDLAPLATRYLIRSAHGATFPFGSEFFPAGIGHTLIFDPYTNKTRSLSLLECWLIQGGDLPEFQSITKTEVSARLLPTPPVSLQFYLDGLSLGLASATCNRPHRIGKSFVPFGLPVSGF